MTTTKQQKYNAKRRAWYEAQPAEYRERFTQLGQPRKRMSHKDQYGETLIEMGKRLGISREAVRLRIQRWGSPEYSAKPPRGYIQKTHCPTSFIGARMLRVWGYDSVAQLAQLKDKELLRLWSFGPRRLKRLRALYPAPQEATA